MDEKKKAHEKVKVEDLPQDRELSDDDLTKVSGGIYTGVSSSLKSVPKLRTFIGGEGGGVEGEGGGGAA